MHIYLFQRNRTVTMAPKTGSEAKSVMSSEREEDASPYAVRARSYCKSLPHSSDYEIPSPLPAATVCRAPSEIKEPRPKICPLRIGRVTGPYLDRLGALADKSEEAYTPRRNNVFDRHRLRRLPYRFRWTPREHDTRLYYSNRNSQRPSTFHLIPSAHHL